MTCSTHDDCKKGRYPGVTGLKAGKGRCEGMAAGFRAWLGFSV